MGRGGSASASFPRAATGSCTRSRKAAPFAGFDEIAVVFHREPLPIGESAKVAIERFVLVR
jgi:hypothetical protein